MPLKRIAETFEKILPLLKISGFHAEWLKLRISYSCCAGWKDLKIMASSWRLNDFPSLCDFTALAVLSELLVMCVPTFEFL